MNAEERLQAIIKERLEGEAFGWGPILTVWAAVTAVRMTVDAFLGPTVLGGAAAFVIIVGFQLLWARSSRAFPGAKDWALQGLWLLLAPAAWFLGSAAPAWGLLSATAGSVLELLFLAGGLTQTGLLRSRRPLWMAGLALGAVAVLVAVFPVLAPARGLAVAGLLGLPAFLQKR